MNLEHTLLPCDGGCRGRPGLWFRRSGRKHIERLRRRVRFAVAVGRLGLRILSRVNRDGGHPQDSEFQPLRLRNSGVRRHNHPLDLEVREV